MRMTNNFNGAVLLLQDPTRADEIAESVIASYFPDSPYHYTVTKSTPENLPVDLRDQMDAHLTDEDEGFILTVYPTESTEVNHT